MRTRLRSSVQVCVHASVVKCTLCTCAWSCFCVSSRVCTFSVCMLANVSERTSSMPSSSAAADTAVEYSEVAPYMDNVGVLCLTCQPHLPQDVVSNVGEFRPSARPRHPTHRGKSPSALFKQIFSRKPIGHATGTRSLSPRRRKVVILCGGEGQKGCSNTPIRPSL